jgi:tRNA(His) 5'-end guanylyltransferase
MQAAGARGPQAKVGSCAFVASYVIAQRCLAREKRTILRFDSRLRNLAATSSEETLAYLQSRQPDSKALTECEL